MTLEELSNEFDVQVNSYSTPFTGPLDFDEYEKSVFLTKAQEALVKNLYTGQLTGFEDTEQMRRYLSSLVKTTEITCEPGNGNISNKSVFATLPEDLMYIVYESAKLQEDTDCLKGKEVSVIPMLHDEYHRIKNNPFRKPNSRRVLRLDIEERKVELISEYKVKSYLVRYLSRPTPIILTDLPEDLKINKINKKTECKLTPDVHRMILDIAVQLAVQSRIPNTGKQNV